MKRFKLWQAFKKILLFLFYLTQEERRKQSFHQKGHQDWMLSLLMLQQKQTMQSNTVRFMLKDLRDGNHPKKLLSCQAARLHTHKLAMHCSDPLSLSLHSILSQGKTRFSPFPPSWIADLLCNNDFASYLLNWGLKMVIYFSQKIFF